MLNNISKYSIKIPDFVSVFYFKNSNLIVFKNKTAVKFLKVGFKLKILIFKNKIFILNNFLFKNLSNNLKKKLNLFKKNIIAFFKHFLIEMQVQIYSKLKLIGVGYKVFKTDHTKILLFKLGYSHSIFLKLNLNFFNIKFVKLFMFSKFYNDLVQISALIQKFKYPDCYKSKGILYDREKIKLKISSKKN